jgi:hypothetical protein
MDIFKKIVLCGLGFCFSSCDAMDFQKLEERKKIFNDRKKIRKRVPQSNYVMFFKNIVAKPDDCDLNSVNKWCQVFLKDTPNGRVARRCFKACYKQELRMHPSKDLISMHKTLI